MTDAIFRPPIRDYIIRKLADRRYQEKQVDAAVVALLVKVAYPQFTKNVVVATTHPDELNARHRQTAFALVDFDFAVPPFYMQNKEHAVRIMEGAHTYRCEECGVVFALQKPVPKSQRPRCLKHRGGKGA